MTQRLALHQLSLYNTGRMTPQQVVAAFAVRGDQFSRIVADVAAEKPKSRPQHHLIVGQRGMGKTMLLARIAAELRTDPKLSPRFIPLVFVEEQYAVDRLSKFWLNCLDSLADARELAGDLTAVQEIDTAVDRLTDAGLKAAKDDQPFAAEVYEAFTRLAKSAGQRPVLLVDNLQLVFERLDQGQQHSLRELLMRPGSPILIGASPSLPQATQNYAAAFYDQFKVHYLRPLDEQEMRDLLLHLAAVSEREDVRQRVLQHPERLKVLRQLTGGNPRTTLTLFFLYAEDFSPSVFSDLEGLLDRVTPLYKARFEELAAQPQVVASAIANNWDPITAAALSSVTGLPTGTISAQLDRLEKIGFIERTELFGETRTGYQIAERFFNIWFLMRSASRRQRREVEFLTRFLENFYQPEDRSRIARQLMADERFNAERYLWSRAVAASLTERHLASDLTRHADLAALQEARDARAEMREVLDFDSLEPATLAFDDLRKKLVALVPEGVGVKPEEFAKAVLGDREMFRTREREKLALRTEKLTRKMVHSVLTAIRKSRKADDERFSPAAVTWFSQRLSSGQLRAPDDAEDWNRTFEQTEDVAVIELMVDSLPYDTSTLTSATVSRITAALTPAEEASADEWFQWGWVLLSRLRRPSDAALSFNRVVSKDPDDRDVWSFLGDALAETDQLVEAEGSFREAIRRNPDSSWGYSGLGRLLWKQHRYSEAEQVLTQAAEIGSDSGWEWYLLGELYEELRRYDEAETAFRLATRLDPRFATAFFRLGDLYSDYLDRPADAAKAYDTGLSINPFSEKGQRRRLLVHRDLLGEGSAAWGFVERWRALPKKQLDLAFEEALFAAYDSNWGLARQALAQVSEGDSDHWIPVCAILVHLNYGAELMELLAGRDAAQHRPWIEALRAFQLGDRRALQNVAPEIRTVSEELYDRIEAYLSKLPEKTRRRPLPQVKQSRTTRRRRR